MATAPVPVKQSVAPAVQPQTDVWRSFRADMDRLFDSFTSRFGMAPFLPARFTTALTVPAVDITEKEGEFLVSAEIPGMTEKEIEVSLSGDTLTIKGEKRQEREEKSENRYLSERSYGEFERSFLLPDNVERDKIVASFANGVLTVTLPKSVKAAPKKIEVKAAA